MPWFRVDDGFHSHPKRLSVSLAAVGLWTVAGSWSSAHLTDGVVPDNVLPLLSPDAPKLAGELVAAGLWKRRKGGYQFHDWSSRNPSKQAVENERKSNAERQKRWREAHGNGDRNAVTNGSSNGVTNDAPALPNPKSKDKPPQRPSGAAPPRATRLPADFAITAAMAAWASENVPEIDYATETMRFRDYWDAKAGANARKLDWAATWRNWMRKAADDIGRLSHAAPSRKDPDDQLAAALRRIDAREERFNDTPGNGTARPVHQISLPAAGD